MVGEEAKGDEREEDGEGHLHQGRISPGVMDRERGGGTEDEPEKGGRAEGEDGSQGFFEN